MRTTSPQKRCGCSEVAVCIPEVVFGGQNRWNGDSLCLGKQARLVGRRVSEERVRKSSGGTELTAGRSWIALPMEK